MDNEVAKSIDPIADSAQYLLIIAFGKTTSNGYPLAVSVAQGAAKYSETTVGKQTLHLAALSKDRDGAAKALAIMKYIGGSKTLQVFCNGTLDRNNSKIAEILECYLKACSCNDFTAHCRSVMENPFTADRYRSLHFSISMLDGNQKQEATIVERYLFPCALLMPYFKYQKGHPATFENQIQAAAINRHCEWCPNFKADAFKKLSRTIIMPDGKEIIET